MVDARTKQQQQWDARTLYLQQTGGMPLYNPGTTVNSGGSEDPMKWGAYGWKYQGLDENGDYIYLNPQGQRSIIRNASKGGSDNQNNGGGGGTASAEQMKSDLERRQAKEILTASLKTFFSLDSDKSTMELISKFLDEQLMNDTPNDAILVNITDQQFWKERFSGNEALKKAGLPQLSAAEYLNYERNYAELLNAAGLQSLSTRDNFAALIGGSVSNLELNDRITNAYQRIQNADSALKSEMQRLGELGNITAADFAAALLTGKEGADSLKRKIARAEISTEFTTRGLTSALGIGELANLGVTRAQASQGAEAVKLGTENLTKLGDIYNQDVTGIQSELEGEQFKGLESQRRKKLTQQEQAAFSGSAGVGSPSLGQRSLGQF